MTISVDATHSEGLMPAINNLLHHAGIATDAIEAVASVAGPGSYTGLRIGMATAQGLAFANKLPCISLSSLDILAEAVPFSPYPLCPLLSARKGWVYARLYRRENGSLRMDTGEMNIAIEELVSFIKEPTLFYGPGLPGNAGFLREILGDQLILVSPVFNYPRADILAEMAFLKWKQGETIPLGQMVPHYLGPSQAEINWTSRNQI